MTYRVKTADAAKEIGCDVEYLRRKVRSGEWDLGRYEKKKGGKKGMVFIFRDKLDKFLGIAESGETCNQ